MGRIRGQRLDCVVSKNVGNLRENTKFPQQRGPLTKLRRRRKGDQPIFGQVAPESLSSLLVQALPIPSSLFSGIFRARPTLASRILPFVSFSLVLVLGFLFARRQVTGAVCHRHRQSSLSCRFLPNVQPSHSQLKSHRMD